MRDPANLRRSMLVPCVKARHMKLFVDRIRELDAGARDEILARVGPDDLRVIAEAAPLAWLPVGINVRATEIVWIGDPLLDKLLKSRDGLSTERF